VSTFMVAVAHGQGGFRWQNGAGDEDERRRCAGLSEVGDMEALFLMVKQMLDGKLGGLAESGGFSRGAQ
jgi:hypothetical protein